MKVKDIARTANVAWSPAQQYPVYMAAGTAAQQLDATFNTSAALEIYALNLADQSMEMEQAATVNTDHRYVASRISRHLIANMWMNIKQEITDSVWILSSLLDLWNALAH